MTRPRWKDIVKKEIKINKANNRFHKPDKQLTESDDIFLLARLSFHAHSFLRFTTT